MKLQQNMSGDKEKQVTNLKGELINGNLATANEMNMFF